jgi:hypothetical protein
MSVYSYGVFRSLGVFRRLAGCDDLHPTWVVGGAALRSCGALAADDGPALPVGQISHISK